MARKVPGQGSHDSAPSLRNAFENFANIFWINSNRGNGPGGNGLEQRMHRRNFAVAWLSFNYEDHMRSVRCGDLIFMYANGLGVIGIGQAKESRLEILGDDHPDRIRVFATEGENEEEWRIPVEWITWDESNPCPVEPLRGTFLDITHHVDRVVAVREHFLGNV